MAKDKFREVALHYILSKIYEELGDITNQTKHLKIVAEKASTLQIAKEARTILSSI